MCHVLLVASILFYIGTLKKPTIILQFFATTSCPNKTALINNFFVV